MLRTEEGLWPLYFSLTMSNNWILQRNMFIINVIIWNSLKPLDWMEKAKGGGRGSERQDDVYKQLLRNVSPSKLHVCTDSMEFLLHTVTGSLLNNLPYWDTVRALSCFLCSQPTSHPHIQHHHPMHDPQPPGAWPQNGSLFRDSPWSLALQADSLPFQPPGKPIYILFLAVLDLLCCIQAFSSSYEWGLPSSWVCRLPVAVASLVVELRLHHVQASAVAALSLSSYGTLA